MKFQEKVLKVVSKIPKGTILSYKEVAKAAGKPRAFRAVGNILNGNCNIKIPCHRVIRSDGKIGGYNRGKSVKIKLLKSEMGMVIKTPVIKKGNDRRKRKTEKISGNEENP